MVRWDPQLSVRFLHLCPKGYGEVEEENAIKYRKGQLKTSKALVFKTKHFFLKGIHRLKDTPLCLLPGHGDVLLLQGKPGASVGY